MKIEKQSRYDRFTIAPNELLERRDLTYRAKGIMVYLLSRPDGWDLTSEALAAASQEGRDAVRAALRELETVGYIERVKRQNPDNGQWSTVTVIYDRPKPGDGISGAGHPMTGNPTPGNPTVGFPGPKGSNTEINTQPPTVVAPNQTTLDIPESEPAPETAGQRTNRIARTYTDRVPLSNFLAVRGVVAKALRANYDEAAVVAALAGLADDGRTVTTDTLRYQLEGFPAARQAPRRETASDRARAWASTARDVSALFSPPQEATGS